MNIDQKSLMKNYTHIFVIPTCFTFSMPTLQLGGVAFDISLKTMALRVIQVRAQAPATNSLATRKRRRAVVCVNNGRICAVSNPRRSPMWQTRQFLKCFVEQFATRREKAARGKPWAAHQRKLSISKHNAVLVRKQNNGRYLFCL